MPRKISRRNFLMGCSAAIAAMAGSRITNLAFAEPGAAGQFNEEVIIVVFLRGGWDALNVVAPIGGTDRGHYQNARLNLKLPVSGQGAALNLGSLNGPNGQTGFGLHPAMAPLHNLYQAQKLAIVHAAGLTSDTRSHFDAMQFMELGTPNQKNTATGWLTRHLQTSPSISPNVLFPALSTGGSQAMSLLGTHDAVAMSDPGGFRLRGHWDYEDDQRGILRTFYNGDTILERAGTTTLDTIDTIESLNPDQYTPANGAQYPGGSFGDNLQAIAQLIKLNVGLRAATVDLGGWDTHEYQGDGSGGYLNGRLNELASGLAALYTDLDSGCPNYNSRTTMVVMSEFGRRLLENANHGTDHGHGNCMFVLGGNVKGGRLYGAWPGLASHQLYDGHDLAILTDYRRVLSEIITRRLNNGGNLATIFPNYTYPGPLDLVAGNDVVAPPPAPGPYRTYLPMVGRASTVVCP
jgi:uncharacterized protein (DUF1501 family)